MVLGNFGAVPKPPHVASNCCPNCCRARSSCCHAGQLLRRLDLARAIEGTAERVDVLLQVGATVAPHVVDRRQQLQELRLGEVRAAIERIAVRREEHRHRPPAAPGHGLHRIHVDRIDVRPFLTVDLHVDEETVHRLGDLVVLERLVRHHVAPVAGASSRPRAGSGRRAPWRRRTPPAPMRTSRPGCPGVAAGRGWFPGRAGSTSSRHGIAATVRRRCLARLGHRWAWRSRAARLTRPSGRRATFRDGRRRSRLQSLRTRRLVKIAFRSSQLPCRLCAFRHRPSISPETTRTG